MTSRTWCTSSWKRLCSSSRSTASRTRRAAQTASSWPNRSRGLLSPALAEEFSSPYVKQLIDAVQDETFLVVYHNCGNAVLKMMDSILSTGAGAYHFGNAVDMADVLRAVPEDTVVMGNIDPAGEFRGGTVESIRSATLDLLSRCGSHRNFVISSGCDIPPLAKWENIDAFFDAVAAYSAGKGETE